MKHLFPLLNIFHSGISKHCMNMLYRFGSQITLENYLQLSWRVSVLKGYFFISKFLYFHVFLHLNVSILRIKKSFTITKK